MQVTLKLLKGSNAGKEVKIPTQKFLIGRGEECHLRPNSDLVSRRHCVIAIDDQGVKIQDLKSRNGTFVNDEAIEGVRQLKLGDQLRVGPLEFEVLIDHSLAGAKRPAVQGVKEAASRAANSSLDDTSINAWLDEADLHDRGNRLTEPDTRQFKMDETDRVVLEQAAAERAEEEKKAEAEAQAVQEAEEMKKKKKPGKLPARAKMSSDTSKDAATDMLKKYFNRR